MASQRLTQVTAPLVGSIVMVAAPGTQLEAGGTVAIVESMKMEHHIEAATAGAVVTVMVSPGDSVRPGSLICDFRPGAPSEPNGGGGAAPSSRLADDRRVELEDRIALLGDAARPAAVAKRTARGLRTARANVADLIDDGSLVEYGRFAYAAQTRRRSAEELIAATPADGLITGTATVGGRPIAVLSYDATVLAGTQGQRNHQKKDRLFDLIARQHLPVVFFTEGGGGRPGDTDHPVVTGLNTEAFAAFAALSGTVPSIGIAAGRCFAGNAALLGCCDIAIGVAGATIGMGGPAMIEGGGLGVVTPEEVGPLSVHMAAGSIDLVADSEHHAVEIAKALLSLSSGEVDAAPVGPADEIRHCLPDDRRRAYDASTVIDALLDQDSFIELRAGFGGALVTGLGRIGGRPVAVLASNPAVNAAAIDAPAADKGAHLFQLAESWGLPIVSLVDTPGFMVGPEAEATGLVRHASRLFVAGAALTVPMVAIITRRGYGLGAQALCGGSFTAPLLTAAWPQAEMGGMGLEGAVKLGFRAELDRIADPTARAEAEAHMIAAAYENGRALNVAAHLEIDDVIDPAVTRVVIDATLARAPRRLGTPSHRFIDPI